MKKMKNINKKIMLIFIAISLFFIGNTEVNAAKFTKGSNKKIEYRKGRGTFYNKKLDGAISYCVELEKELPKVGSNYKSTGSKYDKKNLIAGQIIEIGRKKYSGHNEYLYISEALNCSFGEDGLWKPACSKSKIKELVEIATSYVNKYKYSAGSSTASLPTVRVSTASNSGIMADNSGIGTYVSQEVTISGIETGNYGSVGTKNTSSKPPTYKLSISSSVAGSVAKLCKSAGATYSNVCYDNINNTGLQNGKYYVVVTGGGRNGGNVKLNITGNNESTYPSAKLWYYNKDVQKMSTKSSVKITRKVSAAASFSYPKVSERTVYVEKVDDGGNTLTGASLSIYTAKDKDGNEKIKDLCTTKADGDSSCTSDPLKDTPEDIEEHGYTKGNYLCYVENEVPDGYKEKEKTCVLIEDFASDKTYHYEEKNVGGVITVNNNPISEEDYKNYNFYDDGITKYFYSQFNGGNGLYLDDSKVYTHDGKFLLEFKNVKDLYNHGSEFGYQLKETMYVRTNDSGEKTISSNECTEEETDNCKESRGTKSQVLEIEGKIGCYKNENNQEFFNEKTKFCDASYSVISVAFKYGNAHILVGNALNEVSISKKGITGDEELPGATLAIYKADKDGNCLSELAKPKKFIYKEYQEIVDDSDDENEAEDSDSSSNGSDSEAEKTEDIDTTEGNDSGVDITSSGLKWTSSDTPAIIYGLSAGTYCLKEEVAPKGYKKTSSVVKFSIDKKGAVTTENKDNYDEENNTVIIRNNLNSTVISKTDMATSKELPGATLTVCHSYKDDNGQINMLVNDNGDCVVASLADGSDATWVSSDKPKELVGLAAGTYYLVEKIAPNGYETAESIIFTVKEDGTLADKDGNSLAGNKLVMKDKSLNDVKTSELPIIIIFVIGLTALVLGTTYYSKKISLANNSNESSKIRKRKLHKK